jgi:hypothetical protein
MSAIDPIENELRAINREMVSLNPRTSSYHRLAARKDELNTQLIAIQAKRSSGNH